MDISRFSEPVRRLWEMMSSCMLCPRQCKVNRMKGQVGFCGIAEKVVVSSAAPHFGEEPPLVGAGGSGTIFFAGCNLGCVFCQNYDISHSRFGEEWTVDQLAETMLNLQEIGCSNINLVSPTHVTPQIFAALEIAKQNGLSLPLVYNTGGYDSYEALELIDGMVDIYMPDMKYGDAEIAAELSFADDYPMINFAAVREMHRQVGDLQIQPNGLATKGLLVRHLVLPNDLAGSTKIINFLVKKVSPNTAVNIMDQYRPCYKADHHNKINRRITRDEFSKVHDYALKKGLCLVG